MARFVIGRFAAYGSACAEIGVTGGALLPGPKNKNMPPATARMIAAAMAIGSQLRSAGAGGRTSCGPVLTSGIVHERQSKFRASVRRRHARVRRPPARDWHSDLARCENALP